MSGAKWWYSDGRQPPPLSMNLAVRKRLTGSWDVRVDLPNASGDGRKQHRQNSAEEGHRHSSSSLFQAQAPCSSPPKPNGFGTIWSLLGLGPLGDSELQEEADERLQEPATRPACKISRAPQDDNVMLLTREDAKFCSMEDKKLPGKEETAKKVKPRPEKTSNAGGTKADLHIAKGEEDIGYCAGYVGELMIVTTYRSYSSPFCSLTSVFLRRGFINAWQSPDIKFLGNGG
ncbi:hypothetical protein C1H46_006940 [Malus baccata]|uniref:Uncharacterized protein n=1 Tax=Malus baccata TaxID=106549 RepID=A0A540NA62_MALBA|nr:hypothetical protein C1H46_006940 [Malus baccata]